MAHPILPPHRRLAALMLTSVLLAACASDDPAGPGQPATPVAASIAVSSASVSFRALTATHQLSATVADQQGRAMPAAPLAWSSSSPSVATVSGTGLVTAVGNGAASVTVTSGAASATVQVTVQQVAGSVSVTPAASTLTTSGATQQLTAAVRDSLQQAFPSAPVTWTSSHPSVATVSASGLVQAVGRGATTVTAASGAASASAAVTVQLGGISATISGPGAPVLVGGSAQLTGSVAGAATWSVNGVTGGSARFGTISSTGLYTAPQVVPTGNPVSVRIASAANPSDSASANVVIAPAVLTGDWMAWQPRIVNAARTDSVALLVRTDADYTRVELALSGGSTTLTLRRIAERLYQVDLPASAVVGGYVTGDYHRFVGYIDYFAGSTRALRRNGFVSVRDATMPDVPATPLASDAQSAPHVVNLRIDGMPETGVQHQAASRRFYELAPDDYDFVAILQPVTFFQNRYYLSTRNAISGIGVDLRDAGASYGSARTLQGVVHYPIDFYFDLAETAAVHEIGHRWINFLAGTLLAPGIPHWPYSTLGSGVMGVSIPGGNVGGAFPYTFEPVGDGTYRVVPAQNLGDFRDLDLYLMGLLPSDSVKPHLVFRDQTQFASSPQVVKGPVDTVTVSQIVAQLGPRVPAYGATQTTFRVATIVISAGRLLSADELAFFDHMAARGEAKQPVRFTSGFWSGTTRPFFVATGGRGSLVTQLR